MLFETKSLASSIGTSHTRTTLKRRLLTISTGIVPLAIAIAIVILAVTLFRSRSKIDKIPGPWLYAATRYRLAYDGWKTKSVHAVHKLHAQYGPVVRIGPNDVAFNSLTALKTIYGAGSGFERSPFYRMFDVYGRPNLFSVGSGKEHRDRKRLISNIYTNQVILGPIFSELVQQKVGKLLNLIDQECAKPIETFAILHYFSFDTITAFVYGPEYGGTKAMSGDKASQGLIEDLLNPTRKRYAWFFIHFPTFTKWLISRTGLTEKLIEWSGLNPISRPFVFTGIRKHALEAFYSWKAAPQEYKDAAASTTLMGRLFQVREKNELSDMDIASEAADHLLAGIDTTADTLMFLVWALSLPQNKHCQDKLRAELANITFNSDGLPQPKDLTGLPYMNAVIKETLRLYAPLPTNEPRTSPIDTIVDGYEIPAGTVVNMSPYALHRNETVYPSPLVFEPERWLTAEGKLIPEADDRNRYFWAFSSGARMCIGMHLANAEMLTVTAALYKRFETSTKQVDLSPSITSRYEVFGDETASKGFLDHECWVEFRRL